jgi:hypothetical protein
VAPNNTCRQTCPARREQADFPCTSVTTVVRLKTAHPLLLLSRVQKSSTTKNEGGYSNSLLRAVCLNTTKTPTVSADLPKHAVEPPRFIGLWSAHSLQT